MRFFATLLCLALSTPALAGPPDKTPRRPNTRPRPPPQQVLPDLTVQAHLHGNNEAPSILVRNRGGGSITSGFVLHYHFGQSRLEQAITPGSAIMQALNGPQRAAVFQASTWRHPVRPNDRVRVVVDGRNQIRERNEHNNEVEVRGGSECSPVRDWLDAGDIEITARQLPGRAALEVTLVNKGGRLNGSFFTVRTTQRPAYGNVFRGGFEGNHTVSGSRFQALNQGQKRVTFPVSFNYNPNLEYRVDLKADARCQIDETSEGNNETSVVINRGKNPQCKANGDRACPANPGTGVCTPNERNCPAPGWVRLCAANGHSWTESPCGAGQTCTDGDCR